MGTIAKGGIVDTGPSTWWDRKPFGLSYNKVLAGLFGGVVKGSGELRTADLKMPRLTDLLPQHEQAWLEAIEQYVQSNVAAGTNGTHQ